MRSPEQMLKAGGDGSDHRRTPDPRLGAALLVALGLVMGIAAAQGLAPTRSEPIPPIRQAGQGSSDSSEQRLFVSENPLVVGAGVSMQVAVARLIVCPACQELLLSSESLAPENVEGAWIREDGAVAVDYRDQLRVYFLPDKRDNEAWAKDAVAADGHDMAGTIGLRLIDIDGTSVVALDKSDSGPAAISWIEDGYMIEILGKGGQTLDQLVSLAHGRAT